MQILDRIPDSPLFSQRTSVAIGNFDGVHLGHQEILRTLLREASPKNRIPLVLTFSPHTQSIVGPNRIRLIQTLDQRTAAIQTFKIHTTLVLPFNRNLSSLSGEEFIRDIVFGKLQAAAVIVGDDFHFGKSRSADVSSLRSLGAKYGLEVHSVSAVTRNGQAVSSSLIRDLLYSGNVSTAAELLGRPYAVIGTVIKGKSRGKTLGFPTANIRTPNEILPPGVFITAIRIDSRDHQALTNIGQCPTFNQDGMHIESHLLDWREDLYGKRIDIRFIKKLRDEIRFAGPEKLMQQLEIDFLAARDHFRRFPMKSSL